jgi:hypothetical protein
VKKRDAELGVVDLYEHYQECCRENHLRSFPSKPFSRIAKEEIEITRGLKLRHDLPGENGKPRRGGRDWDSLDGLMLEQGKMGPESPYVECDSLEFAPFGTQGRFDDLDHLSVPASHPDRFWGIGASGAGNDNYSRG